VRALHDADLLVREVAELVDQRVNLLIGGLNAALHGQLAARASSDCLAPAFIACYNWPDGCCSCDVWWSTLLVREPSARGAMKMARTVTIELPDDLEERLRDRAARRNLSIEEVVLRCLRQSAHQNASHEGDPLAPLLGTLRTAEPSDIARRHDDYLGDGLVEKLSRAR
jgi:plasmid stability protein